MLNIAEELATMLDAVDRPGDFVTSGTVDSAPPILCVEGVGQISLPLLPNQAEEITAKAMQAPFGRGEQTIFDTNVRRTWQLGPDKVQLGGKNWNRTLDLILNRIAEGLGVSDPVEATFYKLLVYDKGSFFLPHRDTEKAPGMFATLVLVLPGQSEGGELIVRHERREQILDLRPADPGELGYAAFYADCIHEVRPVTSGYRLALTYNLVRKGKGKAPTAPNYEQERGAIAATLASWRGRLAEDTRSIGDPDCDEEDNGRDSLPRKLVYPLQHAYTPAELTFAGLKGADAAVAGVLLPATLEAEVDLHLALLTVEESGWAEHTGYYGRGSRSYEDQFEAGDVEDSSYMLSHWRCNDDEAAPFHAIPVEPQEISPPDFFEEATPDDEDFQEATGNEGASFERTYQRAALVLWPSGTVLDIVAGAGLEAALFYLENRARLAVADGMAPSAARIEAMQLAERLIATWRPGEATREAARLLAALRQFRERESIARAFGGVIAAGSYDRETIPELVACLECLTLAQQLDAVRAVISQSAEKRLCSLAALLAALAKSFSALLPELVPALQAFVAALPTKRRPYDPVFRSENVDVVCVVDLIATLAAADAGLALRAVQHMLAHPGYFVFDGLLVPAAEQLAGNAPFSGHPAVRHLVQVCRMHLESRIAEPLAPPVDWRRAVRIGCDCENCRSLKAFMADPTEKVWTLRARQDIRSHVQSQLLNANCDLSCATLNKGSPHALICTKNQKSYERRVKQRQRDLKDLASLA